MNYKNEKEDDIDNVAHFFKKLLIDAPQDLLSDAETRIELFIIKIGPLSNIKSANTINTLADNGFKYQTHL